VTRSGTLVRTIDISAAGATRPAGLTCGPGSVHPSTPSIYIAARGVDNGSDPNENDGTIFEMSLTPLSRQPPPAAGGSYADAVPHHTYPETKAGDRFKPG
jgi:hypothetical protein